MPAESQFEPDSNELESCSLAQTVGSILAYAIVLNGDTKMSNYTAQRISYIPTHEICLSLIKIPIIVRHVASLVN